MKRKLLLSVREVLSGTQEEETKSMIVVEVLGTLEPQEEVAELEPSDGKEGLNNLRIDDVEEDRDQEDNQRNNLVEGTPVLNVEEEMQLITSHLNFKLKAPLLKLILDSFDF